MHHDATIELARQQQGLISVRQAIALGWSEKAIRTQVDKGAWQRARRGVYVIGAAPQTWEQEVRSACLAAGEDATASHRSAARLWDLVERSGRIEVQLQDHRRVRLPGVTVHRSILVAPQDIVRPPGEVPRTSLARTIVDLAPTQSADTIGGWIDQGMRDHGLDLEALVECCSRLAVPGRRAPVTAMQALALRNPGHDPGRSGFESRVLAAMATCGLPSPVRQHPVLRADGRRAFIDIAYPRWLLALELDGWATHGVRAAFEADRIRANELALLGWTVLRFTWHMPDRYIIESIARAIPPGELSPAVLRRLG